MDLIQSRRQPSGGTLRHVPRRQEQQERDKELLLCLFSLRLLHLFRH